MNNSRRIKRMGRNRGKSKGLNLTSLMDVFTILVFFLLFNTASDEALESPRHFDLPEAVVEEMPRETVVIQVSPEEVLVQGRVMLTTRDLIEYENNEVAVIAQRLEQLESRAIGIRTREAAQKKEVTILADKTIPFTALRKIMSTCTGSGYEKISLAVIQKAAQAS